MEKNNHQRIKEMKIILKTLLLVCLPIAVWSQKSVISHKDFDSWNALKKYSFSHDGIWFSYESQPYRGDGFTMLMRTDSSSISQFPRLVDAYFSFDNTFFAGLTKPHFDTIRQLDIAKEKKDKWPKDTLMIHLIGKDSTIKIAEIKQFQFAEKGHWVAYQNSIKAAIDVSSANTIKKKKCKRRKNKSIQEVKKIESEGKVLTLWNPLTGKQLTQDYVTDFKLTDSASYATFITHEKRQKKDYYQLKMFDLRNENMVFVSDSFTQIGKMNWDKRSLYFAFLASKDTNDNNKHFSLYHLSLNDNANLIVLDSTFINNEKDLIPSSHGQLIFAEDANRLFFGLAPKPKYDTKDSITKDEKVELDIWHWQDKELQPRQLLNMRKAKTKSFLSVFDWQNGKIQILENDTLDLRFNPKQTEHFLAYSNERYGIQNDYAYPWCQDEYLLRLNGEKPVLLQEKIGFTTSRFSPDGKYIISYKEENNHFYIVEVQNRNSRCLTCEINDNWLEDVNGQPHQPSPEFKIYWENDRQHLWFIAQHDLYRINIESLIHQKLSVGKGKELQQEFYILNWDQDSLYIDPSRIFIQAFSKLDKITRIYKVENNQMILMHEIFANVSGLQKLENTNQISYRISTVANYPDIILNDMNFANPKPLTQINAQQKNFNWANVELVEWKTKKGIPLQGLLYTPENLDIEKSYPMIVYYYELNSENIHRHWTPRPTASIVFPTEYASAGYVIFIPDIRYEPGYPAQGAYDCIMSGTDFVLSKYKFIDSTRMGLQGQSWGGYQTAQLITMTQRYKAAMAGAPVSNMFSAYGGIRWGSGMSRQFQYEHTQSRIGATIWEKPELYTLNSPIFHLPKVNTPLMIMHNDNDGAVPWYQGIELYMGLRRLEKPVWLLNYNKDEHNLMKEANRRDLSIRMRQFFDHYLLDAEQPDWMSSGVKALEK